MKEKIKVCIDNLKHKPGCYIMYDENNTVIYVGKAKDLQKRVSQYFLRPQTGKVLKMAQTADHFETIITDNEKEAFILEMNLIHEHMPRFNILLKDDSHYPYLALKKKGDVYLQIKRNNKDKNYIYFGPFPNSTAAYNLLDLVNKIFPIRKCSTLAKSSCLYYHLGQCLAPCINVIDEETNNKLKEDIISFLRGNNSSIKNELKSKMMDASKKEDYERAAEYKKLIDAIEHNNTKQNVEGYDHIDRDIFAYSSRNGYLALSILTFRNGLLLGKHTWIVEEFLTNEEQVEELIFEYYSSHSLPQEIVINNDSVCLNLSNLLDTKVIKATKGKLHDLVLIAITNSNNGLDEYFLSSRLNEDNIALLDELAKLLNINIPYHIELFDNSHLQGSDPVGAMVAFVNGDPCKKLYRKFHIEHEEARDDIRSMKEVITRHYSRNKLENKKMPDLILVDGGLNQINAAKEALDNINIKINLFGLYKNDKHQTEGLMDTNGNTYKIDNKKIFFLLTRMQDEVHRFAITFHKSLRKSNMTKSILDEIPGLGEKRKEMIKKAYPDIDKLKQASLEDLSQLLPKDVALSLLNKLK